MEGDWRMEPVTADASDALMVAARVAAMAIDDAPKTDAGSIAERVNDVIGDVLAGRTTKEQNQALGTAVERSWRVKPDADKAVGKAIGGGHAL